MMLKIVKDDETSGKHHRDANTEEKFNKYIFRKKSRSDATGEQGHSHNRMHPALPPYLFGIRFSG